MGCTPSSDNNPSAPTHTHIYQRLELLGVGTHGKVYKVASKINQEELTEKLIHYLSPQNEQQFLLELATNRQPLLTNLHHPHLILYHQMNFNQKEISIIMDHSPSGTLEEYVKEKGRITEAVASQYTKQMLLGLQCLHGLGLLHNDLKPSNVMIFQKDNIKLSDYSIADIFDCRLREKRNNNHPVDHFKWNNIPYMAPEVVKNLGTSAKADIWSLGCTVIFMLTGKKPWTQLGSESQTFIKVAKSSVPPLPFGITVACQHFLQSCLSVIPTERLSIDELLDHPFITGAKPIQEQSIKEQQVIQATKQLNIIEDQIDKEQIHLDIQAKPIKISQLKSQIKKSKEFVTRKPVRSKNSSKNTDHANVVNSKSLAINQKMKKEKKKHKNSQHHDKKSIDDTDDHYIVLNNKKVKFQQLNHKNLHPTSLSVEETEWLSPSRVKVQEAKERRRKTENVNNFNQFEARLGIHEGFNHSYFENLSETRARISTQPSAAYQDPNYFKRPLKLLKKKILQKKVEALFQQKLSNQTRKYSLIQEMSKLNESAFREESPMLDSRTSNYQEIVIDTEVARAERNRINEIKKFNHQKKIENKLKWEFQLLKGKEILREQSPFSCYQVK